MRLKGVRTTNTSYREEKAFPFFPVHDLKLTLAP